MPGIIALIIAMAGLLINLIACGAQSKTIKYLKATIEEQQQIIDKQKILIEIYKNSDEDLWQGEW